MCSCVTAVSSMTSSLRRLLSSRLAKAKACRAGASGDMSGKASQADSTIADREVARVPSCSRASPDPGCFPGNAWNGSAGNHQSEASAGCGPR